ncbi:hypothetical protein [Rhodococcus zopfii]|uniref:hypothetical protein n=1 Tax=Rhodococcus zopfii TaxID=43772 RepID=UPI0011112F63|nr:hypothetical protein [Rhodococcus zopfii]
MTTLRIIVPEELIMDGVVDIPQVGDRVEYAVRFDQATPRMHPENTNDVVARVEQLNGGRLSEWTDPYGQIHPGTYPMLLHGGGWRAYSTSTSLYEGTVQLAGSFEADRPGTIPSAAQAAGTTVGRQLITRASRLESEGRHAGGRIDTLGALREG